MAAGFYCRNTPSTEGEYAETVIFDVVFNTTVSRWELRQHSHVLYAKRVTFSPSANLVLAELVEIQSVGVPHVMISFEFDAVAGRNEVKEPCGASNAATCNQVPLSSMTEKPACKFHPDGEFMACLFHQNGAGSYDIKIIRVNDFSTFRTFTDMTSKRAIDVFFNPFTSVPVLGLTKLGNELDESGDYEKGICTKWYVNWRSFCDFVLSGYFLCLLPRRMTATCAAPNIEIINLEQSGAFLVNEPVKLYVQGLGLDDMYFIAETTDRRQCSQSKGVVTNGGSRVDAEMIFSR